MIQGPLMHKRIVPNRLHLPTTHLYVKVHITFFLLYSHYSVIQYCGTTCVGTTIQNRMPCQLRVCSMFAIKFVEKLAAEFSGFNFSCNH